MLTFNEFKQRLVDSLPTGLSLKNPGRGNSIIQWIKDDKICFSRNTAKLYVTTQQLFDAYSHFNGGAITTLDLREYSPKIYDSKMNGHNCKCTFFFLVLQRLGIINEITGTGRKGSPFGIDLR